MSSTDATALSTTLPESTTATTLVVPASAIVTAMDDTSVTPADADTDADAEAASSSAPTRASRGVPTPEMLAAAQAEIIEMETTARAALEKYWVTAPPSTMLWYAGDPSFKYWDFRLPETEALADVVCAPGRVRLPAAAQPYKRYQFSFLDVTDAEAKTIAERSVTIRGAYHCHARATSLDALLATLRSASPEALAPLTTAESYRFNVDALNRTCPLDEKRRVREAVRGALPPMQGALELERPAADILILAEYISHDSADSQNVRSCFTRVERTPIAYYLLTLVARPEAFYTKYELAARPYIGPTSTDAPLAFMMSTFARVTPQSYVYDPFVGTGSIILSAAVYGAATVGQDLDWKVISGRMKNNQATIFDNFAFYGLPRPELVCGDVAQPIWAWGRGSGSENKPHQQPRFDAIVCDPPYGIRAGARRLGRTRVKPEEMAAAIEVAARSGTKLMLDTQGLDSDRGCSLTGKGAESSDSKTDSKTESATAAATETAAHASKPETVTKKKTLFNLSAATASTIVAPAAPAPRSADAAAAFRAVAAASGAIASGSVFVEGMAPYVPLTEVYPMQEVIYDLLQLAAQALVTGGRVCYLIPTPRHGFDGDSLPHHPCLRPVYNCNQILQGYYTRRAVTLEKVVDYDRGNAEHKQWATRMRAEPVPRWADMNELVPKPNGQLRGNGKPFLSRAQRDERRREREEQGLPVTQRKAQQPSRRARKAAAAAAVAAAAGAGAAGATVGEAQTGAATETGVGQSESANRARSDSEGSDVQLSAQ